MGGVGGPGDRPPLPHWPVAARSRPGAGAPDPAVPADGGRRGPGRLIWLAALLGTVVLVAAGGLVAARAGLLRGTPLGALGTLSDRDAGVAAVLDTLTRGLADGSEATYLSAVDAQDTALVDRQRAVFRTLRRLPLSAPRYGWDPARAMPASGRGDEAVTVVADLSYRLEGWDDRSVDDAVVLVVARSGGRWLVVADDDPGVPTTGRFTEPWASGDAVVLTRPHALVVGAAARRAELERLATHLDRVVADVRKVWPEPGWNGRVVAYSSPDPRFVAEWFGSQAATGTSAAPAASGPAKPQWDARVRPLSSAPVGHPHADGGVRLVVTPFLLHRTDAAALSILRHEVTHVATFGLGRLVPGWLTEGAAEYTGYRLGGSRVDAARTFVEHGLTVETDRAMRAGTWRPRLVADLADFYGGTDAEVRAAYIDSWIAALYVADRYGDVALRRLYHAAAGQPESAGWEAVDTAALRSVLGVDRTAFARDVRTYGLDLYRRVTA